MDLLSQRIPGCAPFCRALWTEPLPHETDAPQQRIIHARGVRLAGPARLSRLGVHLGSGYFKCGSGREYDWIRDLRLLTWDDAGWQVALELYDLPEPPNWRERVPGGQRNLNPEDIALETARRRETLRWFDLSGRTARAVLVEVRRAGMDDWWPSWNLATSSLLLEGELLAPPPAAHEPTLVYTEPDLSELPEGVSAECIGPEVRYRTPFLHVGLRLKRPAFSFLALDEEGGGRIERNLLRDSGLFEMHQPLCDYLSQGLVLEPLGAPDVANLVTCDLAGTAEVRGNRVRYELVAGQDLARYRLEWSVWPDRLTLRVERDLPHDLETWGSGVWRLALDSRVMPCCVLGRTLRTGETGLVALPFLLHAPGHGTLRLQSDDEALLARSDAVRPLLATSIELKLAEQPQATGTYHLPAGHACAEVEWIVERSSWVKLEADTPPVVARALRRCALSGLCYRPDTSTFSNNGCAMHTFFCMDNWAAMALGLDALAPNLHAGDLLRDTLQRWLDGGLGYGNGRTSSGNHMLEDEYLMTGAASLLGLAAFLDWAHDERWFARYRRAIAREIEHMRARDLDGDGLVESAVRQGLSGQHQWSTNWYDVISYGWKDAWTNALLYDALVRLARVLPDDGEGPRPTELAAWAARLRAAYVPAFWNPTTGWLAGWRCREDRLHDYGFLAANGAAVAAGLLEPKLARQAMVRLWETLQRSGQRAWRLGLPGNLLPVAEADMAAPQHGLPYGSYENGGATLSQSRHFLAGLYAADLAAEADELLSALCAGLADASAFAGCGSGVDWRQWDGSSCGYEGLLTDQFGLLAVACQRYALKRSGVSGASEAEPSPAGT